MLLLYDLKPIKLRVVDGGIANALCAAVRAGVCVELILHRGRENEGRCHYKLTQPYKSHQHEHVAINMGTSVELEFWLKPWQLQRRNEAKPFNLHLALPACYLPEEPK